MVEEEKKEVAAREKKEVAAREKKEEPAPPLKGDKKDVVEGNDEESKKKKAEDGVGGEGEKTDPPPPPLPPPEELIMRVYMHCEGCARKVQRSLKGFIGVENVTTDCRTHKVVVKGKVAAADPLNVVERVRKKTGRKVELLTPIPPKPEKEEKKEEEKPKPVEEAKEEPKVIAVVLKAHMHCEACSLEIKKRILKMKGVQSVVAELKSSQVTVKGFIEPGKLVEYIYKRTGKHAFIVKVEPEEKAKDESGKDEKKTEGDDVKKEGADGEGEKGNKTGGAHANAEGEWKDEKDVVIDESMVAAMAAKIVELKRNEYYYCFPKYAVECAYEPYPPQFFSDENPNACSVM